MLKDFVEKEYLQSLDDELNNNAKLLKKYIYPTFLTAGKVDGSTYAVVNNRLLGEYTYLLIDKELADKDGLSYMPYAPVVFLSALTGQRVDRIFQVINDVHEQNCSRITTGALNSVLADATARVQPPTDKGRRLKIYYMTQASTKPPHFVIFCNDARLFHFSYQRYLENQIREVFGLKGTPVRITIRQKGDKEE